MERIKWTKVYVFQSTIGKVQFQHILEKQTRILLKYKVLSQPAGT